MILECPSCQAKFKVAGSAIPAAGRTVRCSRCAHAWHVNPADLQEVLPPPTVGPTPVRQAVLPSEEPPLFAEQMPSYVSSVQETAPEPVVELDDDFMKRLEQAIAAEPAPERKRPTPTRRKDDVKPFINPKLLKAAAPLLAASWLIVAFFAYSPSWSGAPALSALYGMFGASETEGLVFSDVTMEREQEGGKARFILAGSIRNYSNSSRTVPTVRVLLKNKRNETLWGREYPVNHELKAGEVYPFRITNVETSFAASIASIIVDMGNGIQLLVR